MRVLHVSGARSWGGNEQQLTYITQEFAKRGIDQEVLCFEGYPLYKKMQLLGISTQTMPKKVKPYSRIYIDALRSVMQTRHFDIIHLHTSDALTAYVITDLIYRLKTTTVFFKKGVGSSTSILSRYKYNYKNIHKIICVSTYVKDYMKQLLNKANHHKLVVVHNGANLSDSIPSVKEDLRETLKLEPGTFLIGNIANHTKAKDLLTLLKSIEYLKNNLKFKNFHLVQIGKPSKLTSDFESYCAEKGLRSHVSFLGFKENAFLYMPQFDVCLISSEREGGPSTLLDAFYFKTPVISTNVGIIPDVIEQGINGCIVEVGDFAEMARCVIHLERNPTKREEFADRSHEKFINFFSVETLADNLLKVYQGVLDH